MDQHKNYYNILGVSSDADLEIIKAAYRVLVKRYHPDSNSNGKKFSSHFQELQEAYEVLSDTHRRREYDALIGAQSSKNREQGVGSSGKPAQEKRPTSPPVTKSYGTKGLMVALGILVLFVLVVSWMSGGTRERDVVNTTTGSSIDERDLQKGIEAYDKGDYATASLAWGLLAEQGDARAQYNMALLYTKGQGVAQDLSKAVIWLRKSAEQGHAGSQNRLGLNHALGKGVAQDNVRAYMWFNIAAYTGHAGASEFREEVAKKMTPTDISKATELARECIKKQFKGC